MNNVRTSELKKIYLSISEDELENLAEKIFAPNSTYEKEAIIAFNETVTERGLSVDQLLHNKMNANEQDRKHLIDKKDQSEARYAFLDKFFSYFGILLGICFAGLAFYYESYKDIDLYKGIWVSVVMILIGVYNLRNVDKK